jgi:hypothetical protein
LSFSFDVCLVCVEFQVQKIFNGGSIKAGVQGWWMPGGEECHVRPFASRHAVLKNVIKIL